MSAQATTTSDIRSSKVRYYFLAAVAVALGAVFAAAWFAHEAATPSKTSNAVVGLINMDRDEVIGVCLKDSPLGPGDGAGTCGAAFLADGVVADPQDLVDKLVKVTVLEREMRHSMPVFLIEAAQ